MQWNLGREPAFYNYMETIARFFIIPSRRNQFIQKNVFNNAPIRRLDVAMNTISAIAVSFHENPFNYQQFRLRELRIIRGGRVIISLDTNSPLKTIILPYTQEVFPCTSLDESIIEFEFETDRNLCLDMRDTHLSLKLQLFFLVFNTESNAI